MPWVIKDQKNYKTRLFSSFARREVIEGQVSPERNNTNEI